MSDIISTQAWTCGDKDCKVQWHQRNFWAYSDGTYSVDEYSDGDHEDCDESDLPAPDEIDASWREYAQHVAATGEDPLNNYYVKRDTKRTEAWHFSFGKSIIGPVLLRARRGKHDVFVSQLPQHVRKYLNLHAHNHRLLDFSTWEELEEAAQLDIKPGKWWKVSIEHRAPRKPETVQRELRSAARRHLHRANAAET